MVTRFDFDVRRLFPRGPVSLLGNLPYYVATQILLRFLEKPTPITLAVLMLQKEVAARLSAAPRSKDYGILTFIVQAQCRVEFLAHDPGERFLARARGRICARSPDAARARRAAGSRSRNSERFSSSRFFTAPKTGRKVAQRISFPTGRKRPQQIGASAAGARGRIVARTVDRVGQLGAAAGSSKLRDGPFRTVRDRG